MTDQAPQNQQYRDDEIDLRKLFQAIGNFFVNIGRGIVRMILAIRRATFRYKVLLLVAIVVGLAVGFAVNKLFEPFYRTSLLLKSEYLNAKLVDNSLAKLNLLCQEKDRNGLAKVLNIELAVAENIVEFEFTPFIAEEDVVEVELLKQKLEDLKIDKKDIDKVIEQIEIENRNTYQVSVLVNDTEIILNLQDALVGYFKNNPYTANRIKANRETQEQLIAKLTNDVAQLDSLKEAYNLNLKSQANKSTEASSNLILGESGVLDPTRAYSQGVDLFKQLQEAKTDYELGSDFELVDGFTTFSKPDSPSLVKSMAMFIGVFLGLAYGLILLIEINKYLNRIEEEGFRN